MGQIIEEAVLKEWGRAWSIRLHTDPSALQCYADSFFNHTYRGDNQPHPWQNIRSFLELSKQRKAQLEEFIYKIELHDGITCNDEIKSCGDRADEKRGLTEPMGEDQEDNTAWKEPNKHKYWLSEMTLGLDF